MKCRITASLALCLAALIASPSRAEPPSSIQWKGTDITGAARTLPASERASLVVLVRPGQPQSADAMAQVKAVLKTQQPQVLVIVSGEKAAEQGKELSTAEGTPGPVVADADFALSGELGVHVWPEIIVVDTKGKCVGRLPGFRANGPNEMNAYLDLANGKITQTEVDARLAAPANVVADKPNALHLQVAKQMLAVGKTKEAESELALAMKSLPEEPPAQLLAARLLVLTGKNEEGLAVLAKIPEAAVPAPQRRVIEGRALIQTGKWTEAIELLKTAVKTSPEPAEAQYLLGVAYDHEMKPADAAIAFRAAAEAALPVELRVRVGQP